jgi:porin
MPARPGDGDPQLRDNHGLAFRVNDPPWLIGQVRWSYDLDFGKVRWPAISRRAAGIIPDRSTISAFTAQGLSIADPGGSGIAQNFAAISASLPSSSRRSTGRRQ